MLAQPFGFQVRRGVEHFLHARPTAGAFVADHHHIPGLDLVGQNGVHRCVLTFEHACRSFKHAQRGGGHAGGVAQFLDREHAFVDTGRLDDAAIDRQIAVKHRQASIAGVSVFDTANAASLPIQVERGPAAVLAESHLGRDTARARHVEGLDLVGGLTGHIPLVERVLHGAAVDGGQMGVQQTAPVQLAQNGHHTACAMDVFDVVFVGVGCHLAQRGHAARQAIDVGHREVHLRLAGGRQQVQHGVGRTTHGDVQRHHVLECLEGGNRARQHGSVVLLVVAFAEFHHQATGTPEQLLAVSVGGHHGAVARQAEPQRLGEAVHGIGSEHA